MKTGLILAHVCSHFPGLCFDFLNFSCWCLRLVFGSNDVWLERVFEPGTEMLRGGISNSCCSCMLLIHDSVPNKVYVFASRSCTETIRVLGVMKRIAAFGMKYKHKPLHLLSSVDYKQGLNEQNLKKQKKNKPLLLVSGPLSTSAACLFVFTNACCCLSIRLLPWYEVYFW